MPIIPNSFTNVFGGRPVQPSFPSYTSFELPPSITLSWPVTGFQTDNIVASLIDITASEADMTITMPPADQVSVGASAQFRNLGEFDIAILDNDGGEIVIVPAEGVGVANSVFVWVTDNSEPAGVWGVIYAGSVNAAPSATALAGKGLIALDGKLNTNMPVTTLIANAYVSTSADRAKFFVYTGGQGTFTLPPANTLPDGFYLAIANRSVDGQLTILPQAPALIDGKLNLVMAIDQDCFLVTNGVNWFTLGLGTLTFFLTNVLRTILSNESNIILTPLDATKEIQIFTGVQNQDTLVTFPNIYGTYFIANNTNASAFVINITCLDSAITTAIPNGATLIFYSDGVDIRPAPTTITDIIFQDGSAGEPSIQFVSSSGDGYYLPAVNRLGVAIAGSEVVEFNTAGLNVIPNGSAAAPSIKMGAANYGFNLTGGTTIGTSIAGTNQLIVSAASVTSVPSFVATAGAVIRTASTVQLNNTANNFSVSLKADGILAANATYTLPTVVPTVNGQPLVSTTGGAMSWATSQFTSNSVIIPNGAASIEIQTPAAPAANYTYVMPSSAPIVGKNLQVTNVAGTVITLDWV